MSLVSSFKDINYLSVINKAETTLLSVTLFIDELNATMTIDKKEIGLPQFSPQKVKLSQIPDQAKVKTFIVWFN